MTSLLLRLFVKDRQNTENPAVRASIGKMAGITGIVCNALLFTVKLIIGLVSGSVAIYADAVNNLSDVSSSLLTLLGFRMARQPADEEHPYGHARYEYLSGLAVSVLILFLGVELFKSAVGKIFDPVSTVISTASFVILVLSSALKLWMLGFFTKLGRMTDSTVLIATAADCRNDVIATTAIVIGCAVEAVWQVNIDGFVGAAAAVLILISGAQMARNTISPLLGKQAEAQLQQKLTALVLSHPQVLGVHDLLVHDYGPGQCYATIHVELSAEESALVCHDIIDDIERDALRELNVDLVIHYDPVVLGDREWDEKRRIIEAVLADISPALSMHDFRLIKCDGNTQLAFDIAVPYGENVNDALITQAIDEALKIKGIEYETVIRFERKA